MSNDPEKGMEENEKGEVPAGGGQTGTSKMTLARAVEMGEYHPEYLSTFPEWHTYPKHSQLQLIRKALDNRRKHLLTQWAEINNVLDFSKKPHLREALKNVEEQLRRARDDKERILVEFSAD